MTHTPQNRAELLDMIASMGFGTTNPLALVSIGWDGAVQLLEALEAAGVNMVPVDADLLAPGWHAVLVASPYAPKPSGFEIDATGQSVPEKAGE